MLAGGRESDRVRRGTRSKERDQVAGERREQRTAMIVTALGLKANNVCSMMYYSRDSD